MKIDRISYQKIFPTGMAYLNHKIGVEIQLDETDNPDEAFKLAKQTVEQWNLESNPGYAMTMEYMKPQETVTILGSKILDPTEKELKDNQERRIASMITDMQSVTDLVVLKTYEFLAKKYPEIQSAYEIKLKELSI